MIPAIHGVIASSAGEAGEGEEGGGEGGDPGGEGGGEEGGGP